MNLSALTRRYHCSRMSPLLLFVAVWAGHGAEAVAQGSDASDRAALEALYDAAGGESWTNSTNWKTSAPLGEWYGVTTDAAGRVTELHLAGNALTGSIPAALGDLLFLQRLDLEHRLDATLQQWFENSLTGPIPSTLGNLVHLKELKLAQNALTGPIPEALGNLENLEHLSLWGNELTGSDPAWLGNLTRLRWLALGGNVLTGPIPETLGNLENLEYLSLNRTKLTGPIPASLGNLSRLWWLNLGNNALTGPIPEALGSLENLSVLKLDRNALTGPIPASLGNLARLETLDLGSNALTGPIPEALGSLEKLEVLILRRNALTGPIPARLANLSNLEWLVLRGNTLTGPVPAWLGDLVRLELLDLSYNWGLSGPLPAALRLPRLKWLKVFMTQTCAPLAMKDWLETVEFDWRLCETETDVTIDVAVFYTPAAREAAGGRGAIEAVIDLMVAETNKAYEASDVRHRLALVHRSEVPYTETGESGLDLVRLLDPSDGHMDDVHALRDRSGADLAHLIVNKATAVCGQADLGGSFGLTQQDCGGLTFAHEIGHNLWLEHDRYQEHHNAFGVSTHPAYGYVNQRAFETGAPLSSRWRTIMAYNTQCGDSQFGCSWLLRFSNPLQRYNGDPLGIAYGAGGSGVTGPADAAAVLNVTGPIVALRRDRMPGENQPPTAARTLPDRRLPALGSVLEVDVSQAFVDPDRDAMRYTVSSSAPEVATVLAGDGRVTLTAVGVGASAMRVTATDPGGLSATQLFMVTVTAAGTEGVPFTDDPLVPGVTPVKEVHFTELRLRIDAVRAAVGLAPFAWTDRVLSAGVTRIRLVHLLELRSALAAAYAASGRAAPSYTDPAPVAGSTPIRAAHLLELREAVVALE